MTMNLFFPLIWPIFRPDHIAFQINIIDERYREYFNLPYHGIIIFFFKVQSSVYSLDAQKFYWVILYS